MENHTDLDAAGRDEVAGGFYCAVDEVALYG